MIESLKAAVVHDWLYTHGGAERVLEQILCCLPRADLFSLIDHVGADERSFLGGRPVVTSFIQRLPFSRANHRWFLPLMPLAVEQFDVSQYELVISSSYAVAKGILTGPNQLHISYVHSPMRYAWDLQHEYLRESGLDHGIKSWLARWILHKIRLWDLRTANGVDAFVANSKFIARRIWKVYRRKAHVIYPPVDIHAFPLEEKKDDFYLVASRLVPYKRVPLIIEAFSHMPHRKLVVVGDGPDLHRCKSIAACNVEVLGRQPLATLREYMQKARAFVFAAEEDFGIVPLEAQACGTPVIAFGKGGVLESIRGLNHPDPTGMFFLSQDISAIIDAVEEFDRKCELFRPAACRANVERFSQDRFRLELTDFVERTWAEFSSSKNNGHMDSKRPIERLRTDA
jgi:glycosyltransferase involved in cell wall biosynthesis